MALKTIVIQAGECAVLPSNATVTAIVVNGSASATSDCPLPTPEDYKCWRFQWEDQSGDSGMDDAYFTSIKIGDTTYTLNGAPVSEANSYDNGGNFLYQAIPVSVPNGLVIDIATSGGTAVNPKCLVFSIPESLGQPIIYWLNPGFESAAFFGEEDQCTC